MTIKSMVELKAAAAATIEDNTTGAISAADVRQMFIDFADSLSLGYGAMDSPSLVFNVPTTPAGILTPWTAIRQATVGYFTVSLANGLVTRQIASAGLAGGTDSIAFSCGVRGTGGHVVTAEIYKNGVATGLKASVACESAANPVFMNVAGLSYTSAVDAVYDVRVSCPTAGSKTFDNLLLQIQSQPVRDYQ